MRTSIEPREVGVGMARRIMGRARGTAILVLLAVVWGQAAEGQSLHTIVEPRGRVFPAVGPGVTVLKGDSSGHYYILAKPASFVSIYGLDGNLVGRIPNANSSGAVIRYAVDIDLSADGLLFVADRGANAVEIFNPDGSLVSKIPVLAPTSVVALPGGQFAVTSLTSKRLVQILDEKGKLVRSFGDPADLDADTQKQSLVDWGKIVASPAGDIYFAFTSLPDPMLRKYDRYGYVSYEASVPKNFLDASRTVPNDRVEVRLNLTHLSLSDQAAGWVSMGSSGDVKFGGGVGTGLSRILGSGGGFGRAGMQSSAWQQGLANTAGGPAGSSVGGTFSGQVTNEGTQFQFGAGNISSMGGGRRGRNASFSNNNNFDQQEPQGSAVQWLSAGNDDADQYASQSSQILSFTGVDSASQPGTSGGTDATADFSQDLGLSAGTLFNSVSFQTQGSSAIFGGSFPGGGFRFAHPNLGSGPGEHGSSTGSHYFGDARFGPHGRFGAGEADFTATLRVNLGDLGGSSADKATITAASVDPTTRELWAGIGDALIHFSQDGNPIEIYYLTMKGGVPLKPSAVLIEPDRFLIAADPWGIFEFPRPQ